MAEEKRWFKKGTNFLDDVQVLALGDPTLSSPILTETLDELEARFSKNVVAVKAVTYISDSEAGGLTFKGCRLLFRKLPFMTGLREVHLQGIGTAQWSLAVTSQTLAQLAAGLHELPSLQVQFPCCLCFVRPDLPEMPAALPEAYVRDWSQGGAHSRHGHCAVESRGD